MITAGTREELGRALEEARTKGLRVGLIPTMGYLHEGHLSLVDIAKANADVVVMSVFVNPLQFGPGEDFERYPRDAAGDARAATRRGVDVLFSPGVEEVYAVAEPAVVIDAPMLSGRLCGAFRPGHFRGVLTVVAKLFNIVRPHVAVFGRKDFQQLALIRAMVRDLDLPVEILDGPIVREADGLAMSSRNAYLDGEQRRQATLLRRAILDAQEAFGAGTRDAAALVRTAKDRLDSGSHVRAQYVEIIESDSLDAVPRVRAGDVIAIAAHVGQTRLIDNHSFHEAPA